VNALLDPKSLSSLSNEDLQRWYSTVDDLCKRESVLNDLQYSIRIDLEEELQARGFVPNTIDRSPEESSLNESTIRN
jgi:hypothetical protein